MQIQLKQREIEEALKQYISQQGISLINKSITIEFTSGRKDNGLSAEVIIDSAPLNIKPEVDSIPEDTPTEEPTKTLDIFKH